MPLPTWKSGSLTTAVVGIQSCRIAFDFNFTGAAQARLTARQGEWW